MTKQDLERITKKSDLIGRTIAGVQMLEVGDFSTAGIIEELVEKKAPKNAIGYWAENHKKLEKNTFGERHYRYVVPVIYVGGKE